MFSAIVRERVIDALEGTPDLLSYVLGHLLPDDPRWDSSVEPEHYNLREILAHLADWDPLWLDRMTKTMSGLEPNLVAVNLSQRAQLMNYASAEPADSLARLTASRPQMIQLLRSLAPNEWKRVAFHPEEGRQSIETQAAWVLAHDDYYIKHAVRCLRYMAK